MGMNAQIKGQKDAVKLRLYTFPTRGNQAEDYHLVVNGKKLDSTRVRTTGGGGKEYTYIKSDDQVSGNQSYWLPGALAAGTEVTLVETEDKAPTPPAPKAAAAAPAAPAKAPAAPKKPAAQRSAAKTK